MSSVINGALSFAFFLAVFGRQARELSWSAPDGLALDFMPQSVAVALMSGLIPALIARRKLPVAPALQGILLWAVLFALGGALLGGLLAFLIGGTASPLIAWSTALIIKIAYGSVLGALVACLAVRRLLSAAHKL